MSAVATKSIVETTRENLAQRRAELEPSVREFHEIESVLEALKNRDAKPTKASPKAASQSNASGPRGKRREQFLEVIRQNPGITVADIAKKIDAKDANYLYQLASVCKQRSLIKVDANKGYHVVEQELVKA